MLVSTLTERQEIRPMYNLGIGRTVSFLARTLTELVFSTQDCEDDPLDLIFDEFRGTNVKRFLEDLLELERDLFLGFASHVRGVRKPDQRNGYYERDLELTLGVIEGLRVPRTRKNKFKSRIIGNYRRRQASVERMIRELFTSGVSTRQVGEILKPLLGIEPSASTVSRMARTLDEEVKRYRAGLLRMSSLI